MNIDKDDLFEETRAILMKVLKIKKNEIGLESKLQDGLGIDSVDFWDIIASFDQKYKIRVSEKEAMALVTVDDLIKLLHKKLVNKNKSKIH